jgi:hypothetical protein
VRRYLFAAGLLPADDLVASVQSTPTPAITITTLGAELQCISQAEVESLKSNGGGFCITYSRGKTCITGFDDLSALHGSYHLLELLGVHFSSTVPVIPQTLKPWVADGYSLVANPAFTTRGLQPFHGGLMLFTPLRKRTVESS